MKTDTDKGARGLMKRIQDILNASRRLLVVSHVDPDGDAVGTQLAVGHYLKDLGKEVLMVRDSEIPDKYHFLPEIGNIVPVDTVARDIEFDAVIVLECPARDRIGSAVKLISNQTTIINIDHHPDNALEGEVNWVDVSASSVGELVHEYFQEVGYAVGPEVATQLYTAVLTDTGRFRFQCTTPRTLAVAGDLVRAGADPRRICDSVYYDMEPSTVLLTGLVLSRLEYSDNGRICLMELTRAMLEESGAGPANTEGLVDYTLYPRGVQVGALLREIGPGKTKISLRSRDGVNIAEIARRLDGGGHPNAAGCQLALPLKDAKKELVRLLQEARETRN